MLLIRATELLCFQTTEPSEALRQKRLPLSVGTKTSWPSALQADGVGAIS